MWKSRNIKEKERQAAFDVFERKHPKLAELVIIEDNKNPELVGIPIWVMRIVEIGYKPVVKMKMADGNHVVMFVTPNEDYFFLTCLENPINLNWGIFKHRKIWDERYKDVRTGLLKKIARELAKYQLDIRRVKRGGRAE